MEPLQTERLTIRTFRPDDWRDLREMILKNRTSEYAPYDDPWPTGEEDVQKIAQWFASGESYLAVCLQTTGKLIGFVAVNPREDAPWPTLNFGYAFNLDYQGQGYATEAGRAGLAHVFEGLGAERLLTGTHPQNLPSCRLLARLGFRALGDGMYELTREEWRAGRGAAS